MFERSFARPHNYCKLPAEMQWRIDEELGIGDWFGGCYHKEDMKECKECLTRFNEHYNK